MKMRIVFKGGAVLDVDVTHYTVNVSKVTNEMVSLDWVHSEDATVTLAKVVLEEIAAVATVHEPGDSNPRADLADETVAAVL